MVVLHLVLYNPSPCYDCMAEATKPLYASHAQRVNTYYYFFDPTVDKPIVEGMFLRLPGKESYFGGIIDKTIKAIETLYEPGTHTCVVRSNVSTVVNFDHLLPVLDQYPSEITYGGPHIMHSESVAGSKTTLKFAQGTCIVLGPKAIECLLQNQHKLNRTIEDDPSFALLLRDVAGLKPQAIGTQYAFFDSGYNISNASAFRNHHFHSDRKEDTMLVMRCARALLDRRLLSGQEVKTVLYHMFDVTQTIREACAENKDGVHMSGENTALDELFGDPAPNVPKNLHVVTDALIFSQNAKLVFYLDEADVLRVQ